MADQTYKLTILAGPEQGSEFVIEKDEIFIGREVSNDLLIPDPEVSRRHAKLTLKPDSIWIEDLGSTNGTFVNAERVVDPLNLQPGDQITLGESVTLLIDGVRIEPEIKIADTQPQRVQSFIKNEEQIASPVEAEKVINEEEKSFTLIEKENIPIPEQDRSTSIGSPYPEGVEPIQSDEFISGQDQPIESLISDQSQNPQRQRKFPVWLLIILIFIILIGLVLLIMPASWWCLLFRLLSIAHPGCP